VAVHGRLPPPGPRPAVRPAASFPRAGDHSIAAFPASRWLLVRVLTPCVRGLGSYGPGEAGGKLACVYVKEKKVT
jgi:hypothetical protein